MQRIRSIHSSRLHSNAIFKKTLNRFSGLAAPGWAQFAVPASATVDMPAGALVDLGCLPVQVRGNLSLRTAHIFTASNFDIGETGL